MAKLMFANRYNVLEFKKLILEIKNLNYETQWTEFN
jgi:hypothetical protein